ncbi:MAG: mannosyltransferase [Alectoria fallacina]|uniref:Chitobiosyldiphosphodolichol beta-mannosyltransferase n=1 Tax=Alectoria fallacina TaxID=1903189 RepID=A0A8H3IPD3_9LECA|nr:MAG: mannosyltransferase [Alectoria fallacina]
MFESDTDSWLLWLVVIFAISSLVLLNLPTQYGGIIGKDRSANRVQILVLGDIGRSPRMQYHAMSIAKHGAQVDLIGYRESDIHPDILANPNTIKVHPLNPAPAYFQTKDKRLFLVYGPLKVLFQIWTLWLALGYRTKASRWMLVQNPPSIPTLAIAYVICFLRHTRLVIDWHNFGYSILALRLGSAHPLVQISRLYEQIYARFAQAHFCVTDAMARVLERDFGITRKIWPLHDRPASHLQVLTEAQRSSFLDTLPNLLSSDQHLRLQDYQRLVSEIKMGKSRLLVSSTSWTPDEDFSVLLEALINYSDLAITTHPHLPEVLVVVTGKGPQKDAFIARIKDLRAEEKLEMVSIETAFLSTSDYAKLLGSADLGVSLHTSSSGVDLPMKVVDMFGAGLPVVGWGDFEAWPELVHEGINGQSFSDAKGLQEALMLLFGGDGELLGRLKQGAVEEGKMRWDKEWDRVARKLFFPN